MYAPAIHFYTFDPFGTDFTDAGVPCVAWTLGAGVPSVIKTLGGLGPGVPAMNLALAGTGHGVPEFPQTLAPECWAKV
jgi:hypothetical protein